MIYEGSSRKASNPLGCRPSPSGLRKELLEREGMSKLYLSDVRTCLQIPFLFLGRLIPAYDKGASANIPSIPSGRFWCFRSRRRSRVFSTDIIVRVFALGAAAVPAAAMAQSLFSVLLLLCVLVSLPPPLPPSLGLAPPCPLSKCVVGRKGNKRGSEGGRGGTYQPQYRRVKWTLLVRAIAIQQESSAPLLSTPLLYSLSFSSLSSDFPEQRKGRLAGCRAKGILRSD